jgi:hypothetical protein
MSLTIDKRKIEVMIEHSEYLMNDAALNLWDEIKIDPERWNEESMDEPGGFWVVAIFGKKVLYYNNIEEGFNISPFRNYGTIDDYLAGQSELHDMMQHMYNDLSRKRI